MCDQMKEAGLIKSIIELIPSAFDIKKEVRSLAVCNVTTLLVPYYRQPTASVTW